MKAHIHRVRATCVRISIDDKFGPHYQIGLCISVAAAPRKHISRQDGKANRNRIMKCDRISK